jgi:hypothetical protein
VAVHPLRPANHPSLGRPLPYQLANSTQALHSAIAKRPSFSRRTYAVLTSISRGYSSLNGRFSRVTHPFAAVLIPKDFLARLACVRHAASIHSEPGSNSSLQKLILGSLQVCRRILYIFLVYFKDRYLLNLLLIEKMNIVYTSHTMSQYFFLKNFKEIKAHKIIPIIL